MPMKLSIAVNGDAGGPLQCFHVLGKIVLIALLCFSRDELDEEKCLSRFSASVKLNLHRHLCAYNKLKGA